MIPKVHCVTTLEQVEALERAAIRPVPAWLMVWVRLRTDLIVLPDVIAKEPEVWI
jgi:hypothetical protein